MKRIKAGIIGSGFGLKVTLPCLSAVEEIEIAALCSREPAKVKAPAAQFDIKRIYSSWEELVAQPDLDLICVETPPFLHAEMSIAALNAGKHVLCEKPMALSVEQAEEMLEAQEASGRKGFINHQLRFNLNIRKIKQLLERGDIGEVRFFHLTYFTRTRLDQSLPWNWWSEKTLGGGQLFALGSHFVDLTAWLFGDVEEAKGDLKNFCDQRPDLDGRMRNVTSDEYSSISLSFSSGCFGQIVTSTVVEDEPGIHFRIVGSDGSLVLDGFESLTLIKGENQLTDISEPDPLRQQPTIGLNSWRTALVYLAKHLADGLLRETKMALSTFRDGVHTQIVLEAVRTSAQNLGPIKIVPKMNLVKSERIHGK